MRKLAFFAAIALTGAFGLSACNQQEAADQTQQQVQAAVTKPTDGNDTAGWKKYLVQVVTQHMQGVNARPYMYFVPGGDNDEAVGQRQNQQDNVSDVVARTVLPGNMMAFGGPESAKTADLIVAAFKNAQPGSFKGVVVLFVGDAADQQRVGDAVKPSAAEYRFVQM
ncbi:MAG: hypothetical protein ABFC67_00550 [Mizugakiibacter sp.]|uniref:hypothetical protein n=1 Tax=Mizugakiibacter sp. TaxID=1972610 RepID=UPI0031C5DFF6|nr:hypothetical protein [Xanthomonadaceae bacterium]